jgi:hypothetical protein
MELSKNQHTELVDKTNKILAELFIDSAIIKIDSINSYICDVEVHGKTYQLQAQFVLEESKHFHASEKEVFEYALDSWN